MRLYVLIIYGFIGCVHIPYVFLIISVWKQCPFVPLTWRCPSSLWTPIHSHQNWTWYSSQKYKGKLMFFSLFWESTLIISKFWPDFGPKKQSNILQKHFSSFHIKYSAVQGYIWKCILFHTIRSSTSPNIMNLSDACEVIFTTSSNFAGRDRRIPWGLEGNLRGMWVAWECGSCAVISAAVSLESLPFFRGVHTVCHRYMYSLRKK